MRLFLVLILFIALQFIILLQQPLIGWDEAVYVGIAKYIASSGTVGLWEDLRPLLLPLFLSIVWQLTFQPTTLIFTSKIIMIVIALCTVFFTYLVSKKLFDTKTAAAAATILMITPLFVFSSHLIHTELLSTIFGLVGMYFFLNKKYYLTGAFLALAFLTKFPQGILLAAFVITLLFSKQNKNILKIIFTFVVITSPFFIFNFLEYGNILHTITAATPHQNNPTFSVLDGTTISYVYNILYYPLELVKQNIFLIFIIPSLLKLRNKKQNPLLWILLLFLAYFTIALNKQTRFALLFLPYIAIFAAQGTLLVKRKYVLLVGIIFLATFSYFSYTEYFALKTVDEPIMEFYTSFDTLQGPILTANPIPAAYSNKLFIPFYHDVETAHQIYDEHKDIPIVAYTTEFYPCSNYVDIRKCDESKKELVKKMSKGRKKVYSIEYGQEYAVYSFPNASFTSRSTKQAAHG